MHDLIRPDSKASAKKAKADAPPVLVRSVLNTPTRPPTVSRGAASSGPAAAGRIGAPPQKTTPDPQAQAQKLNILTTGTKKNLIAPVISEALMMGPYTNILIDRVGQELTANALMGTTRRLATLPKGKANKLQNYSMPVIDETLKTIPQSAAQQRLDGRSQGADGLLKVNRDSTPSTGTAAIRDQLVAAKKNGTLTATLAAFQVKTGKSLYTVLGEQVRNPAERAKLLNLLPAPLPIARVTRDAFLENIAVGYAYSDLSGHDLNTSNKPSEKGGTASQVLKAFNYSAGDAQKGAWGMELRVFTPDPVKAKGQPVVIVFRGTDGVALNMKTNPDGTTDSVSSDFAQSQPGHNQFTANKGWIDAIVKQATANGQKVTFVGHSLGSGLAQQAAVRYAPHTAGVVTFQGANIAQTDVNKIAAYNKAHPDQQVLARQYRVDGDTVPTSGTASLPGSINYFDRVTRPAGSTQDMGIDHASDMVAQMSGGVLTSIAGNLASRVPMLSPEAATSGHTMPILNTYLRGLEGTAIDAKQVALLKYGIRDTSSYPSPIMKDGKPVLDSNGKPTFTPVKDVGVVYGGGYDTKNDPRVVAEAQRAHVMPEVVATMGADVAMFKGNIAYNTALHHLFETAGKAKTYAEFQAEATSLLSQEKLAMVSEDVALAKQLNLDKSPRANVEYAIKDLIGVDASKMRMASDVASVMSSGFTFLASGGKGDTNDTAAYKLQDYLNSFSTMPTMDQYRSKEEYGNPWKPGEYEVEITDKVKNLLLDPDQQRAVWKLYHPGSSK